MKHRLLANKCELYHGIENTRPYFEGWYFKHVSKELDFVFSVICGISKNEDSEQDHSFIQIIIGPEHKSYYIKFPYSDFSYSATSFDINIGDNSFSKNSIKLNIERQEIHLKAVIEYSNHINLHNRFLSPSIMGPYSYIPNMECNHGVISLRNVVGGLVEINGETYNLLGSKGYIEKDWGEAFPDAWIWLQGSSSAQGGTSFMCSIASIPFGLFSFTGLICVLEVAGKQYRFATYNNSKILDVKSLENGVEVKLQKGRMTLNIKAYADGFEKLIAPTRNGMTRSLQESVAAKIDLVLLKDDNVICEKSLDYCGMEISEIGTLVKHSKKL